MIILLDGPMGSLLAARGVPTPAPAWSAAALWTAPDAVRQIHVDYAAAGARVHTANTFRTKERQVGSAWRDLTKLAVSLARKGAALGHRPEGTRDIDPPNSDRGKSESAQASPWVAGSLAPLEDCYRPDLSPPDPRPEHRAMARALAEAGVDLIVCETFPHVGEGLIALEEAVATGLPVWMAFTAGPEGDLLTPREVALAAREAANRGARAVLINCTAASRTLPYVEGLAHAGVPFGAYANAGDAAERFNEAVGDPESEMDYLRHACAWLAAGATIVGSCCGTGPGHIRVLAEHLGSLG